MTAHISGPSTLRLEMSARSFGVVRASRGFCIHCLRGGVWITQEARRDDIVLARGDRYRAQGAQRVFLNSFKGALLALSGAVDASLPEPKPLDLWLEITQGGYVLCGGRAEPRDLMPPGHRQQDIRPMAAAATGTE